MSRLVIVSLVVLSVLQVAGCPYVEYPTFSGVRVQTSLGEFVVELDPDRAPLTVANFLQYVDDDFYDGTIVHRVVPGFVIQGGGYTPELTLKETRPPITNEAGNGLSNVRTAIAMARTDDPDSAKAQFFVNVADNVELDAGDDRSGYAVFGWVIEGMDVIGRIAAVPTEERGDLTDVPVEDVIIEDIERLDYAGGGLQLTSAGETYLASVQLQTVNLVRELIGQAIGYVVFPP